MTRAPAYRSDAQGFTLIELSIVLVIIGLIVGGVLVGRDLIHAAEIRATVKQVEQYNTAVNAFLLKYNCLPGDCLTVGAFGLDATTAGDGDFIIGECAEGSGRTCSWYNPAVPAIRESYQFWYHLNAAQLINDYFPVWTGPMPNTHAPVGINTPRAKITGGATGVLYSGFGALRAPGGWWVQNDVRFDASAGGGGFTNHSFILANSLPVKTISTFVDAIINGGFLPMDAYAIDIKIDDGLPLGGTARGWSGYSTTFNLRRYSMQDMSGGAGGMSCAYDDGNGIVYNVTFTNLSNVLGLCQLAIKATF